MEWIMQMPLAFIAALSFGVIFNVPRKTLLSCGLVGTSSWLIFELYNRSVDDFIQATFFGAFAAAIAAHVLARRFRMPMIIFSVSGIIMLVPGGRAFNAMRNVVENDYLTAMSFASEALMVSGAIAMGLVFGEVFMQLVFKIQANRRRKKAASSL